jgi:hypothetical protein
MIAVESRWGKAGWLALLFGLPVVLIPTVGPPAVFATGAAVAAATAMLVRPRIAIFVAVFLLYSNIAVVFGRQLPNPQLAMAAIVLPLAIPVLYYWVSRREGLRTDTIFRLMLVLLGVELASCFVAKDLGIAAMHVLSFLTEGILLYFLIINAIRSRRALTAAMTAAVAAGALLGALSLYQATTRSYTQQFGGLAQRDLVRGADKAAKIIGPTPSGVRLADRSAGPVGDPNRYAQMLVVLLPLGACLLLHAPSRTRKLLLLGGCLLLLAGVVFTYSRGAFVTLGLLVGLLVLWRSVKASYVVTGVILLALSLPFVAPSYYSRIQTLVGAKDLVKRGAEADADNVLKGRATEMFAAFQVLLDHPFLGVGPGQYMPFYSEKYQLDPDFKLRQLARQRRAHNLYLEMGAEVGFFGLAVFVAMPLMLVAALWRLRKRLADFAPEDSRLALAFCLAILGYLATGMFLHLAFERYFWFLLALSGAATKILATDYTQLHGFKRWR